MRRTRLDFWALPRSVQDRFVACTAGLSAPTPIAARPREGDTLRFVWLALGLLGLVLALFLLSFGFGDLESRYALAPEWFLGFYAGAFTLSAIGFFVAAARHERAGAVPYVPALYLFPVGVVDARTAELRVYPLSEDSQVRVDSANKRAILTLDGEQFVFPVASAALGERIAEAVSGQRARLANAGPESSAREQSLLDPLLDNGFKNPFAPAESMRKVLPRWVELWPLWAIILGVLLSGASFQIRNRLSEDRLYARARAADSVSGYRAFLARGGTNGDVTSLLLPRAELRDAVKRGTVSALEQFRDQHPNTQIKIEADAALDHALRTELATAQSKGTLDALKDFGARYARYPSLAPAIEQAIESRIRQAMAALTPALANSTRELPFFERLLRYMASHGPALQVRFQSKASETADAAERTLRRSAYFTGESTLPSHYFDPTHATPREREVSDALVAALNEHLPPDFAHATAGPPLALTEDTRPTVPTLLVSYHPEMSGAFTIRIPRLALSGIGLLTRTTFEIPGSPDPLVSKLPIWRAPDFRSITETTTPEQLYETMARDAWQRFTNRYLTSLFTDQKRGNEH